jgi:hypothetical protein
MWAARRFIFYVFKYRPSCVWHGATFGYRAQVNSQKGEYVSITKLAFRAIFDNHLRRSRVNISIPLYPLLDLH